jgi:hypothetical protein
LPHVGGIVRRTIRETQLAIKETTLKGRRYVLCRNEEEARKDADRRAAILAGLDRKLTHGDKALVSNKNFRRFVKTIGSGNFSIDYGKVEADAKFDGLFVLRTNTKSQRFEHALHVPSALAGVFDQIEILVGADLLDPDEHRGAPGGPTKAPRAIRSR